MDESLRDLVWRRARGLCEYCRLPYRFEPTGFGFQIDYIIAEKHRGQTIADNLALACFRCNAHKGPNIAGIDRTTRQIAPLFHPRRQRWEDHFFWDGPIVVGRTPEGRATIEVLEMNEPTLVAFREALIAEGVFPPAM